MNLRRLRVFLDANILHRAAIRDFILRVAEAGAIDVRWSGRVLEETRGSLESRGFEPDKVDRLIRALRTAFPDAEVEDFEHLIPEMDCSDPNDRHVLAAAIAGEADILVTDNSGDFPAGTSSLHALALMTGDEAAAFLVRLDPMRAARIARAQIADLVDPPSSEDEFLRRIAKQAPEFATALGSALGNVIWAKPTEGPDVAGRA